MFCAILRASASACADRMVQHKIAAPWARRFVGNGWNWLDLSIVVMSLIDFKAVVVGQQHVFDLDAVEQRFLGRDGHLCGGWQRHAQRQRQAGKRSDAEEASRGG